MSFEAIDKAAGCQVDAPVTVSCMKRQATYVLAVRMRPSVMDVLGVKIGDRLTADRGVGKDAQWLRLTPGDLSGFTIASSGHRGLSGYLFLKALSDNKKRFAAAAAHKIVDGALYVELPDWACTKSAKAA